VDDYLRFLRTDANGEELARLIDELTTNFTSFRREPAHFELLRTRVLPGLKPTSPIRIWSAGCSSGEEPYSILMEILDFLGPQAEGRIRIFASDISGRMLERAVAGIYPLAKLDEIPGGWKRFLEKGVGEWSGHFRIGDRWKSRIVFDRLNLMDAFDHLPVFDVIFCRNVMIYFDRRTQEDLVRRLSGRLAPSGWLLIGHSEGLTGNSASLQYVQPAVYRRPGAFVP
jgi:chemotaxis protein methyltransferase CheR